MKPSSHHVVNEQAAYKRIQRGWSAIDAWSCPEGKPLWIHRAESQLAEPLHCYMARQCKIAAQTGETITSIAALFSVPRWRLEHYCRQNDIKWPKHVSRYQREVATATLQSVNSARRKTAFTREST